ncbi:MAG: hypothetical protein DRP81_05045 [Candidatus Omnitrophota bacterium]|nr:MAG: hypothetical protein DRP81_05045 [Candidatus Omnitrophota bacterium]
MKFFLETLNTKFRKGITLIIAISLMLILALLGWTVANFLSADLRMSSRLLDSERALYLAEAGIDWTLKKLGSEYDCDLDEDGKDISSGSVLHNLEYGQYRVNCECEDRKCKGIITIESTGYIPGEDSYYTRREVEVTIDRAGFTKAAYVRNFLDWSEMSSRSRIDGDIQVLVDAAEIDKGFEGPDLDTITNEPEDLEIPGRGERIAEEGRYPTIDMDYFREWAQSDGYYRDYSAVAVVISSGGNVIEVDQAGFFTGKRGEVVRNLGENHGSWQDTDWAVITKVTFGGKRAELDREVGDTWIGDSVRIVKRFSGANNNQKLWYIEGSDILIDLREKDGQFNQTSLVGEGDIVLVGDRKIRMKVYVSSAPSKETFPNLATKEGNIYLRDAPKDKKSKSHSFDGLIYTEDGDVVINYIEGRGVMGYNVFWKGIVKLKYNTKYIPTEGFLGNVEIVTWWEK